MDFYHLSTTQSLVNINTPTSPYHETIFHTHNVIISDNIYIFHQNATDNNIVQEEENQQL